MSTDGTTEPENDAGADTPPEIPSPSSPPEFFPRSKDLPKQSPLFWVAEKDRYLRQLLIRDIQEVTGRTLLVYYANSTDPRAQISFGDDAYFAEMIRDAKGGPVDLLIETPGGITDATEKLAALLRALAPDLRVIVPRYAKSNGTMLALVGSSILMGPCSELGPSDPLIGLGPNNFVPAHFLATTSGIDPIIQQYAIHAIKQTAQLAQSLLSTGMMKGKSVPDINQVVDSLSTRNQYPSHGSVIDMHEAERLGLSVIKHGDSDELWQRLWLLRCMYDHDLVRAGAIKIFEGPYLSNTLKAPPGPPGP